MRRLLLICCVMLAGCGEARRDVPELDARKVSSSNYGEIHEVRHGGKVYLVLRLYGGTSAPATKLDEWPDPEVSR